MNSARYSFDSAKGTYFIFPLAVQLLCILTLFKSFWKKSLGFNAKKKKRTMIKNFKRKYSGLIMRAKNSKVCPRIS